MNTLQLVVFLTLSLLASSTIIPVTREYLPPTAGRTFLHASGNSQQYYPSRPVYTTGGYYQPGLANPNHDGASIILGLNSGQNQYYNPGFGGVVSGQYNPGYGGEYYSPGLGGGIGHSGHYYNPSIGGGGLGYYNNGLANGGLFAQGVIVKPGYKPRSVIASEDGYVYGKKK